MPYVKQITIRTTLNRSLKYIVNDKKTDYGCFVTGVNCATDNELAYKQMIKNKKNHDKEKGTLGFHFIQSFKEHEISDPYKAHEIGLKWAEKFIGDKFQYIISTHLDKGHVHNHIVLNSVSLDGKKFYANKQSLKDARDTSDQVSREYNLNVIPFNKDAVSKYYQEWKEDKRGASWKTHVKNDIDTVIKSSKSFDDFISNMEQIGYTMKQGTVKYMTFKHPDMERSVRGKTLGAEYTEERIKERIQFNEFHFEAPKRKTKYRFKQKANRNQLIHAARQYQYKRGSLAVNFILTIALVRTLIDRSAAEVQRRITKRNFRADIEVTKLSNQLKFITDHNLKSRSDLKQATDQAERRVQEIRAVLKEADDLNRRMKIVLQTIETYNKYKSIYDEYQRSTIKKMFLKKKHSAEIDSFEKALNQIKKMGIQEHQIPLYVDKQKSIEKKMEQLKDRWEASKEELSKLMEIEKTLNQRNQLIDLTKDKEKQQNRDKTR